ncbi:MAG: hypothetical protein ACRDHL_00335 [Candidatus Promineifilaceae bacterium]
MSRQPSRAIVRGERIDNVSPKGGRSYARVRGLLQYFAYGRYADQIGQESKQRGAWLDQSGRVHPHDAVQQWAKEKVHHFGYDHAYQLLLSTRDGQLSAAEFNRALQQGSDISRVWEWRLMMHDDSDHQHAHAILFSHEKLAPARYREWQQAMQAELEQLQAGRQRQLETTLALESEPPAGREQARGQIFSQDWELAND